MHGIDLFYADFFQKIEESIGIICAESRIQRQKGSIHRCVAQLLSQKIDLMAVTACHLPVMLFLILRTGLIEAPVI